MKSNFPSDWLPSQITEADIFKIVGFSSKLFSAITVDGWLCTKWVAIVVALTTVSITKICPIDFIIKNKIQSN